MSAPAGPTPRLLAFGERLTVQVAACNYWTDTWLDVVDGAEYEFHAEGRWTDIIKKSDPDGYDTPWWSLLQWLLAGRRRMPNQKWFALCGAVRDSDAAPFLIGSNARPKLPSGRLLCFANDVPGFYWNNSGSVTLTVERTV